MTTQDEVVKLVTKSMLEDCYIWNLKYNACRHLNHCKEVDHISIHEGFIKYIGAHDTFKRELRFFKDIFKLEVLLICDDEPSGRIKVSIYDALKNDLRNNMMRVIYERELEGFVVDHDAKKMRKKSRAIFERINEIFDGYVSMLGEEKFEYVE